MPSFCEAFPNGKSSAKGVTGSAQIHPRFARVVRHANCFQSIFGSQASLDFIIVSQVTSSPV